MTVLALTTTHTADQLAEADELATDLASLTR